MYPPIKYKRSKNMEYYSEIMCDEIYADYEPIEPSEDYDPIADMLYTLGLRYYDVMGNCCKDYRNAFRPLEAFLYKVFSDHESFYEFMNCPYDPPQVDINDLVYFYEHYYYNNAAQVYEMSQGEMKYEL